MNMEEEVRRGKEGSKVKEIKGVKKGSGLTDKNTLYYCESSSEGHLTRKVMTVLVASMHW